MQYKCDVCHDSGSKNKDGYLDCTSCEAAADRAALEVFIKTSPRMEEHDLAWSIHQRALAMAPKKEADHINDVVKMVCPARWKLVPVVATYEMERAAANGPGRSTGAHMESPSLIWKSMLDAAPTAPAAANIALTEEQIVCALGCIANGRNAGYISTENAKVVREFIRAAAGPDAALVKALEGALAVIDDYLTYTHDGDPWKEDARAMGEMDINDADNDGRIESWRAALSGAKGNS